MYFEIMRKNQTLVRGSDCFGFDYSADLNSTSSFSIMLPIRYLQYTNFRNEIKMYLDDGTLVHGVMSGRSADKVNETITVDYEQILNEWERESVPINVVKKHQMISDLMVDPDTAFQETLWNYDISDDYDIEYEYSRETKLEALNKTIELTPDINYRVSRTEERTLEIGKFGEHKPFIVSAKNIIGDLTIEDNYASVINYATSYGDKNDGGSTSVTLRDVAADVSLQDENFPIVLTSNTINTAAPPVSYSFTEYAPNTVHEYAVVDLVGLERTDGDIHQGTFTRNDISAVQESGAAISNADRVSASVTIYNSTRRKLSHSRPSRQFSTQITDLPISLNVGDKVRFVFDNTESGFGECDGIFTNDIIAVDEYLYLLSFTISSGDDGELLYDVTLAEDIQDIYTTREV